MASPFSLFYQKKSVTNQVHKTKLKRERCNFDSTRFLKWTHVNKQITNTQLVNNLAQILLERTLQSVAFNLSATFPFFYLNPILES